MPIYLLAIFILLLIAEILSDQKLAEQIKNGNKEAFRQLFDRHYRSLVRYLVSRKCDGSQAEDLAQNAFLYVWEHRQEVDASKSIKAYLFQIVHSRWLNTLKREAKNEELTDAKHLSGGENTEQEIHHNELITLLMALLEQLPEKRQQVFRFCFLEQFTYKETADLLGISVNTVENHMQKAFQDLRQGLQKRYML